MHCRLAGQPPDRSLIYAPSLAYRRRPPLPAALCCRHLVSGWFPCDLVEAPAGGVLDPDSLNDTWRDSCSTPWTRGRRDLPASSAAVLGERTLELVDGNQLRLVHDEDVAEGAHDRDRPAAGAAFGST